MRFPEFSGEWEKCTIGDFVKIQGGYAFKSEKFQKQGIPIIRISNLPQNVSTVDLSDCVYYDCCDLKNYEISNGELLIAMSGATTGKTAVYRSNETAYLNQRVGCFRIKDESRVFYPYLYGLVDCPAFRSQLAAKLIAGAQPNISSNDIETIKINLPKHNEQIKIASILEALDQRIETQKKIIEDLKKLKDAINNSLHNNINEFQLFSFNELGNDYSGLTGKSSDDFGSGLPYISYLNVFRNNIVTDGQFDCVKVSKTEKQNVVSYGDLLFTLSSETPSEVGIGAIYLGKTNPIYLNSFCFGVHLSNQENIYGPYLAYFVTSQYFRKTILPFAQGSTRYNLMKSDFMKHKFCFPSFERQKEIHNALHALSVKIQNEEVCLNRYSIQKQYLLTQMFI